MVGKKVDALRRGLLHDDEIDDQLRVDARVRRGTAGSGAQRTAEAKHKKDRATSVGFKLELNDIRGMKVFVDSDAANDDVMAMLPISPLVRVDERVQAQVNFWWTCSYMNQTFIRFTIASHCHHSTGVDC